MSGLREDMDRLGRSLWLDFMRDIQRAEIERIEADPERYRDTTLAGPKPFRYRYFKRGRIRYCWATTKNAAGYWLTWVEVVNADGSGERKYIRGHRRRNEAKESALKAYENKTR